MPPRRSPARSESSTKRSSRSQSRKSRSQSRKSRSQSRKSGSQSRKSRSRSRKSRSQSTQPRRQRKASSSPRSESRGTRRISKSEICNLGFPVARVKAMLKVNNHGLRISDKSAVFLTSALEYMAHEILELSLNVAREEGRSRIMTKHLNRALKTDPELVRFFKNSSVRDSTFISLNEMINAEARVPVQAQEAPIPVPELLNAGVTRPVSRRKPGSRSITSRQG